MWYTICKFLKNICHIYICQINIGYAIWNIWMSHVVCHDSFICAPWLIHMCDMTPIYIGYAIWNMNESRRANEQVLAHQIFGYQPSHHNPQDVVGLQPSQLYPQQPLMVRGSRAMSHILLSHVTEVIGVPPVAGWFFEGYFEEFVVCVRVPVHVCVCVCGFLCVYVWSCQKKYLCSNIKRFVLKQISSKEIFLKFQVISKSSNLKKWIELIWAQETTGKIPRLK